MARMSLPLSLMILGLMLSPVPSAAVENLMSFYDQRSFKA